jgi:hypothetical protein
MRWDNNGSPRDLEAAAADALLWLDTLDKMTRIGRARFVRPDSSGKLNATRLELARFLPLEARSIGVPEEAP